MHARPLAALVGSTTALLTVLTVAPGTALGAPETSDAPETTESQLQGIDESGLQLPGARGSSTSTTATTDSLTTNVPSLLRAPAAQAQLSTGFTQSVAQQVGGTTGGDASGGLPTGGAQAANLGTGPGAASGAEGSGVTGPGGTGEDSPSTAEAEVDVPPPSGSVSQTTEDGITIAALSDEMALPEDAPGVVGLVYDAHSDVQFEVRTKVDGEWTAWDRLDAEEVDGGTPGTDPYYVTGAQGLQVRILGDDWDPAGTRVLLVDPKTLDSDAEAVRDNQPVVPEQGETDEDAGTDDGAGTPETGAEDGADEGPSADGPVDGLTVQNASFPVSGGTSSVTAGADGESSGAGGAGGWEATTTSAKVTKVEKPNVRTRKDWGASKKLGTTDHDVAGETTAAIVHHSAGANDYDAEDVPAILRGIHTFHVEGRGWDDVGYNMFADKYGRLWEGRAGSLSKAVVGAHAVGYNTGTFGISVLGTYEKKAPPKKTRDAVAGAIAWKLSQSGTSADAKTTIAGDRIRTVSGHRDVGQTSCPGDAFYSKMGEIRSTAVEIQQGDRDVNPESEKKSEKKDSGKKKSDSKDSGKKDSGSKDSGSKKKSEEKESGGGMTGGASDMTPGVAQD